jgi:AcrR family transcriptional regulator
MTMPPAARPGITPARPSTSAQRARYARILHAATAMLALGGEEALQIKELADRADVLLATLYRYFPSKDYVLLAISSSRYENALRRIADEQLHGATARERVTNHLLREFGAEQREETHGRDYPGAGRYPPRVRPDDPAGQAPAYGYPAASRGARPECKRRGVPAPADREWCFRVHHATMARRCFIGIGGQVRDKDGLLPSQRAGNLSPG